MKFRNVLLEMAAEKHITGAQFALAWLLEQKPFIVPIPGIEDMKSMEENVGATKVVFTKDELKIIRENLEKIKIFGYRYDPDTDNAKSVRK